MQVKRKLTPFLALIGKTLLFLNLFLGISVLKFGPFNFNNLAWATGTAGEKSRVRPYLVILDPGHGGEDLGTSGILKSGPGKTSKAHGKKTKAEEKTIYEKDINLAIALRVERVLKDRRYTKPLGRPIEVVFTRRADKTVPLPDRSKVAQKLQADLYLSIHANYEKSGKVNGFETYILKNDEASAKKLAEIQARGDFKEHESNPEIDLLLSSVAADATSSSSKQAAELIHASVLGHLARQQSKKNNRGIKQKLLFVLLNAQTPAVLLESFYMSNPKDLAFIAEPENRQKIAEGIAMGILRFLVIR